MDAVYRQLCKKYPDMATKSEKKLIDLKENWERLEDLASARYVGHLSLRYWISKHLVFKSLLCVEAII